MRRASLSDINEIAELLNDPLIRPTIGGEGKLDPTPLLIDPRNICLFDERGGAMFAWRGPGIYEGHSFFKVRGRDALKLGREIISMVPFKLIWGLTPLDNKPARWFNRQLGFSSLGEMETPEGRRELFVLEK